MKNIGKVVAAAILLCVSTVGQAQALDDTSRGSYVQTGSIGTGGAGQAGGNYLTGSYQGDTFHSFFVFNLFGIGAVSSATLSFTDVGFSGGNDPHTLSIYDYSGNIAALTGGSAGVAGHTDLGSGTLLGSALVPIGGTSYSIIFNAAGISALNANAGGQIAFGGVLTSIGDGDQFVFGDTIERAPVVLTLQNSVPEPATWAMMLIGFGAMGVALRRGKRTASLTQMA